MIRRIEKWLILWVIGGFIYFLIEIMWRGYSHWTMFVLGGACFLMLGSINNVFPWEMPLWKQVLIGTFIITIAEFFTGCLVNIKFGWQVWNYSHMPGNILGQICPQYILLWVPVSLVGIIVDDWLRYWLFDEEKPRYKLI